LNLKGDEMVEIENRGLKFRSWKRYATFLIIENRKLQQLLPICNFLNYRKQEITTIASK